MQVAIIPADHTGNIYSFLRLLLNELRILESAGMKVDCPDGTFDVKVHLLLASDDIIGVQELINHGGCNTLYGCRQCHIKTIPRKSPTGKGTGHYYKGTAAMSAPRTDDEFKEGNKVRYSILSNIFGINLLYTITLLYRASILTKQLNSVN